MAHAYTPGLQVKERARYRATRLLPIAGRVLVEQGAVVGARDLVARTELPGDAMPLNLANQLSINPADLPTVMVKGEGDSIEAGELMARTNGIFGLFKSKYTSPVTGTIESVSHVTGQVIVRGAPIEVEVRAFATGTVSQVLPQEGVIIDADVTFIQGIFGIGGEAYGPIRLVAASADEDVTAEHLTTEHAGAIVVGGRRIHGDAVHRAVELGVSAIISGGIDDRDLHEILGYDLGVAVTGTENVGLTLIITEGFGDIAMAERTFDLLRRREGSEAAVNGATQIRAGVQRPEILIPIDDGSDATFAAAERVGGGQLHVGSPVRIIRDPYFGVLGEVTDLPTDPQVLDSGSKARVLEVLCESGERVIVPRANVEITEG